MSRPVQTNKQNKTKQNKTIDAQNKKRKIPKQPHTQKKRFSKQKRQKCTRHRFYAIFYEWCVHCSDVTPGIAKKYLSFQTMKKKHKKRNKRR